MANLKTRSARNQEDASKCWNEIGNVILGRARETSDRDFTYKSGMSVGDIMEAFSVKKQ